MILIIFLLQIFFFCRGGREEVFLCAEEQEEVGHPKSLISNSTVIICFHFFVYFDEEYVHAC